MGQKKGGLKKSHCKVKLVTCFFSISPIEDGWCLLCPMALEKNKI